MAVRRPNKNAPSSSTRKPTVAGRRKPVVDRGDDAVERAEATETLEPIEADVADAPEAEVADADSIPEPDDDFVPVDEPADSEPTTAEPATPTTKPTRVPLVKADEAAEPAGADDDDAAGTTDADASDDKADDTADEPTVVKPSGKARRPVSRVSTIKADSTRTPVKPGPAPAQPGRFGSAVANVGQWGKRTTTSDAPSFVSTKSAIRLAVAAVVIGLIALVLAFTPGASIGPNKAFINQGATDELMSQARSKLCLPVAVTSKDFDKWAGQARAVLVGEALKNFNEYLPTQKQLIQQSKLIADCRVDSVGVRELTISDDGDRARVLANILVSQNLGEQLLNSAAVRVDYTMEKHGDQWMISGVDPF